MDLARQISDYATRVSDLRARQRLRQEQAGFFDDLYEEVSQGIEELRIIQEELRQRDGEIYQAYAAVVQERRRYRELFALGPDAHLITDDTGVAVEANRRAEQLLGCQAEHLRGKPMIAFVPGAGQRALFREWFAHIPSSRKPEALEVVLRPLQGAPFAAELRVVRIAGETASQGQLLWALVDVSQKHVTRRDAELAAVVRVSADAILIISMEHTVIAQNPTFERLYGDLVGSSVRKIIAPECWDEHRRTIAELSEVARVATVDTTHVRAGGERVTVFVTYSLIDEAAGSRPRAALVIRDISAQKQLESSLRQRATASEQSDRRKTEFIGFLAHELRNPLNVITSAAQALGRNDNPALYERFSATCLRNARHMARLIDDLLDLSLISRNELPIAPRSVSIRAIVERAVELVGPTFQGRQQDLQLDLPEQVPVIRADPMRLAQAISNLLDNAAKYTPRGGRVRVSVEREDGDVHIRVEDNGAGIPPELINHVFEPFVRARIRRATGGLGLGLALVRRIVELHGGTVRAESAGVGLGARFTVTLPLGQQPEVDNLDLDSSPFPDALDR